ncbi:hypothetical protein L1987_38722 [Smallanthus sonchifolius]|uniref:Uncharacterized protein n=1 Tax=Smallanthus sonchifolius TaxID=185202 RepID=A0ACB9HJF6_9ASTR|nr:hypothetical protein L1987_38722 [Smallanthus sonchifolius]
MVDINLHFLFFQGLTHFDEILQEEDVIILSRGNLGINLPPEKVIFIQYTLSGNDDKSQLYGSDAIILGAETLRGLYPVDTISNVGKNLCRDANFIEDGVVLVEAPALYFVDSDHHDVDINFVKVSNA